MSYPSHDPYSPGSAPQPGWGQQPDPYAQQQPDPYAQQQGWGQQQPGWGAPHAQGWASTPTPQKKTNTGMIAILVAVAVLVAGVGIWAFTRNSAKNNVEPVVTAFFDLLNDGDPGYSELTKYVTGIDFMNVYEATKNSPGGTWSVVSVGDVVDEKVSVTWKHNDKEFTNEFQLRTDNNKTKLYKPFAYVTFNASQRLRFVLNPDDDLPVGVNDQVTLFPGSYTILPVAGYSGAAQPNWEPVTPTMDFAPGEITKIPFEAKLTDKADGEYKKAITDAFNTCLASDSFYPGSCPFRSSWPSDSAVQPQVKWGITPADAPSNPVFVEDSTFDQPCYQIKGTIQYTYNTRNGGTNQSKATEVTSTGCIYVSLGNNRVTWTR